MAINQLSVGRQFSLSITTPNGQLTIPTVTDFTIHATPVDRKSVDVSGNVLYAIIPSGFEGSIMIDRTTPILDQYWAAYEAAYYAGQNLASNTITETITEANGSISQWIVTGVMFVNPDFGQWSGNDIVKQRLNFVASRYQQQV